jgi:hypothetical protein
MAFSVIVLFRFVESAQEVVGRYPTVEALCFARYYLNMEITVGQVKIGISSGVCADLFEDSTALCFWQKAHTSSGEEKEGGVFDSMIWHMLEGVFEKGCEVIGADSVWILGKGGYAWLGLFGPVLVGDEFWQCSEIGIALFGQRMGIIAPFVYVNARTR